MSVLEARPEVKAVLLQDDGRIPNNATLPLIIYEGVLRPQSGALAPAFELLFHGNQWAGSWRNGIYSFHHYHSTAHEVLGIARGSARVQFGGEQGPVFRVAAGDAVLIPAGGGHKNLGSSSDLLVVGAYPLGQTWDMCRGAPEERPWALQNIARVPLPAADPIYGEDGPLGDYWPI